GIRDFHVTGVQTCALPIWPFAPRKPGFPAAKGLSPHACHFSRSYLYNVKKLGKAGSHHTRARPTFLAKDATADPQARLYTDASEIGRASCRECEPISGGSG